MPMMKKIYHGGCLCGQVRFEITSKICNIVHCHCSLCRKARGSAFATNGNIDVKGFVFTSGEKKLTAYRTGLQTKYFCKNCGSPIISKNSSHPEILRVRLGTIETDIEERPEAHIFCDSKANWENLDLDIARYSEYQE